MDEREEILNNVIFFKLLNREKRIRELEYENKQLKIELNDEERLNPTIKKLKYEIGELKSYIDELESGCSKGVNQRRKENKLLKRENLKS